MIRMRTPFPIVATVAVVLMLSSTGCRTVEHTQLSQFSPEVATRLEIVEAQPEDGFYWPYLLYTPDELREAPRPILVLSLNSPQPDDSYEHHWDRAFGKVEQYRSIADTLGMPLLIGALPRFLHRIPSTLIQVGDDLSQVEDFEPSWVIGVQSLNRNSLITPNRYLARPDHQILAMVDDARLRLDARGVSTDPQIVPIGFSASGTFALRLTLLHPDRVLAVAGGAPGGYYPLPVAVHEGVTLDYPLGTSDIGRFVEEIHPTLLAQVPMLVFAGEDDPDDSVPYLDAYTYEDRVTIEHLFGTNPIDRYRQASQIWKESRRRYPESAPFTLALYPEVGHTFSVEMRNDVTNFIEAALDRDRL
jgi:hypothetical protein